MNTKSIPLITHLSWGQIEVQVGSETRRFRDCKLWPGGAREWNWKETGTKHQPGVQTADLEDILTPEVEIVILGRGRLKALGIPPETEQWLREKGVTYHIEETARAVEIYNRLARQGKRVAGLFHTTC